MKLSDGEIQNWHAKFKSYGTEENPSLNIIIVPDFSNRLKEIPDTKDRDVRIISDIYEKFFNKAKTSKSKDRLLIEVTDRNQVGGIFGKLSDSLIIDLSARNKEQARKFLNNKEKTFKINIENLYSTAYNNISGADYIYYFRRNLSERIKKNTIEREYINKVIILTDGYLETKEDTYTKLSPAMKSAVLNDRIEDYLRQANLEIPKVNADFSNVDVLILEITERKDGIGWHKEVLNAYWKNWLASMKVRNINDYELFKDSNLSHSQIKEIITEFLDQE